jgi:hypothetical protein
MLAAEHQVVSQTMSSVAARLAIPDALLSVVPAAVWSLQQNSFGGGRPSGGQGSHLLHIPSGIQLSVRTLPASDALSAANLDDMFTRYADISWPGARRTARTWIDGPLRGISGEFQGAMPDAIVREWFVTDGTRLANAATFATEQQWDTALRDCEILVRSIRFE